MRKQSLCARASLSSVNQHFLGGSIAHLDDIHALLRLFNLQSVHIITYLFICTIIHLDIFDICILI